MRHILKRIKSITRGKQMVIKTLLIGLIAMAGNGAVQEDVEEPLEQLSQQEICTFTATNYTAYCEGCSGITYNGTDVRNTIYKGGYNVIAVDPNVIELGTVVTIEYNNGETIQAIADDIGGAINGNRIDILVQSKDEAYSKGVKEVKVYRE